VAFSCSPLPPGSLPESKRLAAVASVPARRLRRHGVGRTNLPCSNTRRRWRLGGATSLAEPHAAQPPGGGCGLTGRLTRSQPLASSTDPPRGRVCSFWLPVVHSRGANVCRAGTLADRQPILERGCSSLFLDRRPDCASDAASLRRRRTLVRIRCPSKCCKRPESRSCWVVPVPAGVRGISPRRWCGPSGRRPLGACASRFILP
jgi:hypothetical protein